MCLFAVNDRDGASLVLHWELGSSSVPVRFHDIFIVPSSLLSEEQAAVWLGRSYSSRGFQSGVLESTSEPFSTNPFSALLEGDEAGTIEVVVVTIFEDGSRIQWHQAPRSPLQLPSWWTS